MSISATAEESPFWRSMNTALCDLDMPRLRKTFTYLLTYFVKWIFLSSPYNLLSHDQNIEAALFSLITKFVVTPARPRNHLRLFVNCWQSMRLLIFVSTLSFQMLQVSSHQDTTTIVLCMFNIASYQSKRWHVLHVHSLVY